MARIRKGDLVLVRAGDDAGRRGRVLRVLPEKAKALVEGMNVVFKHLRKGPKHPQGGRVQRENWIPLSRLVPIDPTTDRGTRVSYRVEGGEKRRYARGSGTVLEGQTKPPRAAKGAGKAKAEETT
jgi:large subunit ribosomal protein L24